MMEFLKDDKNLTEVKSRMLSYLADRIVRGADKVFDEKKYTAAIVEIRKSEYSRKPAL